MPERVDKFPKAIKPNELFDNLTDGSVWLITEAEWKARFSSIESAKGSARYYANSRDLKAKVLAHGGDLYVQFSEPKVVASRNELAVKRGVARQARLAGSA